MNYHHIPLFTLLTVFLFTACNTNEEQENAAPPPQQVPVVEVPSRSITGYTEYPARIEGVNNNDVRAKISGYIQQVYVDEGEQVKKGQRLFRLETDVLSQDANAAQASIQSAEANIESAQAAVNSAQVEVNKLKPLVEKDIISSVQLETAEANLEDAKARLSQARAAKSQAQAGYQSVQANINYSVVRAPISGVVGTINRREGSLVGPSDQQPITTVSQINDVYAYFSMNESEYLTFLEETPGSNMNEKLNNTPDVELVLANGSTFQENGTIETITGQINSSTGTIQFRATFNNKKNLLSNGNSGTIRVPKTYENVLVIPLAATSEQQEIISVMKVIQDSVQSASVTLKDRINNLGVVDNGLQEGDRIVAKGIPGLTDGTKIRPQQVELDSIVNSIEPIFNE